MRVQSEKCSECRGDAGKGRFGDLGSCQGVMALEGYPMEAPHGGMNVVRGGMDEENTDKNNGR